MKSSKSFGPKLEKTSNIRFRRKSDKKMSQIEGFFEDTILEEKKVYFNLSFKVVTGGLKKLVFYEDVEVCYFSKNHPPEAIKSIIS